MTMLNAHYIQLGVDVLEISVKRSKRSHRLQSDDEQICPTSTKQVKQTIITKHRST